MPVNPYGEDDNVKRAQRENERANVSFPPKADMRLIRFHFP
jgi:hypothetical protein